MLFCRDFVLDCAGKVADTNEGAGRQVNQRCDRNYLQNVESIECISDRDGYNRWYRNRAIVIDCHQTVDRISIVRE